MKNPLFRALNQEAAGIAQGRFLKVAYFICAIKTGENQKFILVSTLSVIMVLVSRNSNTNYCFGHESLIRGQIFAKNLTKPTVMSLVHN